MGFTQLELDNHFGGAAFLAWLVLTVLTNVHDMQLLCNVLAFTVTNGGIFCQPWFSFAVKNLVPFLALFLMQSVYLHCESKN